MNTSDLLSAIESKAAWLKDDAKGLADFIGMLAIRRDFPTLAEAAMDATETELIEALKSVRLSRTAYLNKPKDLKHENLKGVSF